MNEQRVYLLEVPEDYIAAVYAESAKVAAESHARRVGGLLHGPHDILTELPEYIKRHIPEP